MNIKKCTNVSGRALHRCKNSPLWQVGIRHTKDSLGPVITQPGKRCVTTLISEGDWRSQNPFCFKESVNQNWNFQSDGGFKPRNLLWEGLDFSWNNTVLFANCPMKLYLLGAILLQLYEVIFEIILASFGI